MIFQLVINYDLPNQIKTLESLPPTAAVDPSYLNISIWILVFNVIHGDIICGKYLSENDFDIDFVSSFTFTAFTQQDVVILWTEYQI